jgi:CHAD domain-containing protein
MKNNSLKKRFPFALNSSLPLKSGLLRSISAQNRKIVHMTGRFEDQPETAIHEIRKSFKRLRSILALLKPVNPEITRKWNNYWRDCSRKISQARQMCVLVSTIRSLSEIPGELKSVLDVAVADRNRIIADLYTDGTIVLLNASISATAEQAQEIVPAEIGFHDLETGLDNSFSNAKKQFDNTLFSHRPAELHELRKKCKIVQYHTELISRLHPDLMLVNKKISDNTELLGLFNDLNELQEWGDRQEEVFANSEWFGFKDRIRTRQHTIKNKALHHISEILRMDTSDYLEMYSELSY